MKAILIDKNGYKRAYIGIPKIPPPTYKLAEASGMIFGNNLLPEKPDITYKIFRYTTTIKDPDDAQNDMAVYQEQQQSAMYTQLAANQAAIQQKFLGEQLPADPYWPPTVNSTTMVTPDLLSKPASEPLQPPPPKPKGKLPPPVTPGKRKFMK